MGDTNSKTWRRLLVLTLAVILAGSGMMIRIFVWYHDRIYNQILEEDMLQIDETSQYVANGIRSELTHSIHVLQNMNESLNLAGAVSEEEAQKFLQEANKDESFSEIGISYLEEFAPDNTDMKITKKEFADVLEQDGYYISNVQFDGNKNKQEIFIAVPFYNGEQMAGAIWAKYPISKLAKSVELDSDTFRYFQIIDDKGNYISRSSNHYVLAQDSSLWEELKKYQFPMGVTAEKIQENIESGKEGSFWLQYKDTARYVSYEPLGINNWYIFSVLAEDGLNAYVKKIEQAAAMLLLWLGCFMVFVLGIVSVSGFLMYRKIKQKNFDLEVKEKVFNMIQTKTNTMIFVYNKKKGIFTIYHNDAEHQEEQIEASLFQPDIMRNLDLIKKEDYDKYEAFFRDIYAGKKHEPIELQIRFGEVWEWKRIYSWEGNAENIICFMDDYSEQNRQRREMERIHERASRDTLTGLYNRERFEQQVEGHLERKPRPGRVHALFYLDLDHFKEVNDELGHLAGDKVLQETAEAIRTVIRKDDLACRVGGDEFVLFLPDTMDMQIVEHIAQKLVDILKRRYEKDGKTVILSASVGVAVTRGDKSLKELYEMADTALYEVKKAQRNGYKVV